MITDGNFTLVDYDFHTGRSVWHYGERGHVHQRRHHQHQAGQGTHEHVGGSFTFSKTGSVSSSFAGAHGSLTLNSDGSYTYTPTADNSKLAAGESAVEAFNYTMQDSQGVTSSSTLYITVYGAGSADPVATNDTATAIETGVSAGTTATGNVITNDKANSTATAGSGVTVTEVGLAGGTTTTTLTSAIAGTYGSLSIDSTGAFTYTVTNSNTVVDALNSSQTLTEVFNYKIKNSSNLTTWAKLTITIQGANDAGQLMWDPQTGGGFDGLHADGVNRNQGAESTLAVIATLQHARRISLLQQ